MMATSVEYRVSLLLKLLGDELASSVLSELPESRRGQIRQELAGLNDDELDEDEIDEVLDEFERLLRLAVRASGRPDLPDLEQIDPQAVGGKNGKKGKTAGKQKSKKPPRRSFDDDEEEEEEDFSATGDLKRDLNMMPPMRLAAVLENEESTVIAVVLQSMHMVPAGEVLELLPDTQREAVFNEMRSITPPHQVLLERALRTTLELAEHLDTKALKAKQSGAEEKLAQMLRAMNRKARIELLRGIETNDAEAAERIRDLLYTIDDIGKLTGRSIQRLLGSIDTATLATALKDADEAITTKILDNLSKRAAGALKEEIEYMGNIDEEVRDEACKTIVRAMIQLDEQGELNMEEEEGEA